MLLLLSFFFFCLLLFPSFLCTTPFEKYSDIRSCIIGAIYSIREHTTCFHLLEDQTPQMMYFFMFPSHQHFSVPEFILHYNVMLALAQVSYVKICILNFALHAPSTAQRHLLHLFLSSLSIRRWFAEAIVSTKLSYASFDLSRAFVDLVKVIVLFLPETTSLRPSLGFYEDLALHAYFVPKYHGVRFAKRQYLYNVLRTHFPSLDVPFHFHAGIFFSLLREMEGKTGNGSPNLWIDDFLREFAARAVKHQLHPCPTILRMPCLESETDDLDVNNPFIKVKFGLEYDKKFKSSVGATVVTLDDSSLKALMYSDYFSYTNLLLQLRYSTAQHFGRT